MRARSACSKSEFHVAREDTKFARNNLKVNYSVKSEIEQHATPCLGQNEDVTFNVEIVETRSVTREANGLA